MLLHTIVVFLLLFCFSSVEAGTACLLWLAYSITYDTRTIPQICVLRDGRVLCFEDLLALSGFSLCYGARFWPSATTGKLNERGGCRLLAQGTRSGVALARGDPGGSRANFSFTRTDASSIRRVDERERGRKRAKGRKRWTVRKSVRGERAQELFEREGEEETGGERERERKSQRERKS